MKDKKNRVSLLFYDGYIWVWAGLIALTIVTVLASMVDLERMSIFAAMLIASVKAGLVLLYFMHIRHEKRPFPVMIAVTIVTYGIFLALTFLEYLMR